MSDPTSPVPDSSHETPANLRQLAAMLRDAAHLEPQAQKSLANLLDELGRELDSTGSISAKMAGLTAAATEVARSLHEQHPVGLLETARDRLQDAATRAETEAPVATGVAYRLLEFLSNMGI